MKNLNCISRKYDRIPNTKYQQPVLYIHVTSYIIVYICFVDDVLQMYEFALKYMPFCLK